MHEISKTQRKKAMLELQKLGEELTSLNREQLDQLTLPGPLLEAIQDAKRLNKFGARKRQLQYIGRLMRDTDAQAIREKLDTLRGSSRAHAAWLHKVERWRDRLLTDECALETLQAQFSQAELQPLRILVRNAQAELQAGKLPRSYRDLFQELKKLFPEEDG
ncbi:MAG TPA: ribosome biogenesis factor YjgA [Burkholderiales bacterium]|nr:ribosome biogenesis factor YjgA [Burkholderiales bacterium]